MNGFKTITGWHMLANMLVDVWIAFFGFPLIWCKKPHDEWRLGSLRCNIINIQPSETALLRDREYNELHLFFTLTIPQATCLQIVIILKFIEISNSSDLSC